MSNVIEEKLDTRVHNEVKDVKLKTAYDYLNQISFTVDGASNKTIELLSTDAICLLGNSRMTNLMLTKIAVHCLMPKKYGGLRSSRVFTIYQLTHFLKYELLKTIHDYRINIVIIPDLLAMFLHEAELDIDEVEFLVTEIADILKLIIHQGKLLLITSLSLDDKLPPSVLDLGNRVVKCFNKYITIDKNKTNDKFKILIQQKQGADYVAVSKYLSLSAEDLLTVIRR